MGENTNIEWAHHTFNPWEGCTKVGPGCDHCYAETRNKRFHGGNWGPGAPRRRTSPANWAKPRRWNAQAAEKGVRYRVFCASLADVFDNEAPTEWRADLFKLISETPHLDWLLLTKRIGNVVGMVTEVAEIPRQASHSGHLMAHHWRNGRLPANVWLGATVVNQQEADRDIPKLLATPARLRWLSMEPLLGPVQLPRVDFHCDLCGGTGILARWPKGRCHHCDGRGFIPAISTAPKFGTPKTPMRGIDWVIVGGESGTDARPMHPEWALDLRDQCVAAGVPLLFKQWGEWVPRSSCYHTFADGNSCSDLDPECQKWPCIRLTFAGRDGRLLENGGGTGSEAFMQRLGKKAAGRLLDGRTWDQFPGGAK